MTKDTPINCNYKNENELYLAFMPFIKGGGLFIRTKAVYEMGASVSLSVQLLNEPDTYLIEGKVVWITPKGAQGNKPMGIGVQFTGENSRHFCNKIESSLAGMLKSTQNPDTI
jgi:type IV pilus assembly protein PilZ